MVNSEMQKPIIVAASILSADFGLLAEEVRAVDAAGADWIHVDVMDGRFVPAITIGPVAVEAVRRCTRKPLNVHLMIVEPERYLTDFAEANADHLLVLPKIRRLRQLCELRGLDPIIEVDGGQNCESAELAIEAGANAIAAGSAIFGSPDYAVAIAAIRAACQASTRKACS